MSLIVDWRINLDFIIVIFQLCQEHRVSILSLRTVRSVLGPDGLSFIDLVWQPLACKLSWLHLRHIGVVCIVTRLVLLTKV